MVELRKRPAPPPAPPPAKKKATPKPKTTKEKPTVSTTTPADPPAPTAPEEEPTQTAIPLNDNPTSAPSAPSGPPNPNDTISLTDFGGEIQTNSGEKTTLASLVQASKSGVVLFTYPKASTPGCTTQACLFRDAYTPLTTTGLSLYGLSTDSPSANSSFKTKQNLPYTLLSDPQASLIGAIGFKKSPKGTQRGVFVVDKAGKVLAREAGGPAATVEVVKGLVGKMDGEGEGLEKAEERVAEEKEGTGDKDKRAAEAAAEVADDAEAAGLDAKV
ncbi:hypothetical protein MBLNU230_g6342t1 [Neophaeotheca triangularis]